MNLEINKFENTPPKFKSKVESYYKSVHKINLQFEKTLDSLQLSDIGLTTAGWISQFQGEPHYEALKDLFKTFEDEAQDEYEFLDNDNEDDEAIFYVYFIALIDYLKDKISNEFLPGMLKIIVESPDKSQDEIKQEIYDLFGAGNTSFWFSYVLSAIVMLRTAALNSLLQVNDVGMVMWVAYPGCCHVCDALSGKVWQVGHNPEPVKSTHRNCVCDLIPLEKWEGILQDSWKFQDFNSWNAKNFDTLKRYLK